MITETEKELSLNYNNKKICILCTNGTRYSKVYENNSSNINYPANQDKVMSVVTNTKAGLDVLKDLPDDKIKQASRIEVFPEPVLPLISNFCGKSILKSDKDLKLEI